MKKRLLTKISLFILPAVFLAGCASIMQKRTHNYKTTDLFGRECNESSWQIKELKKIVKDTERDCVRTDIEEMTKKFLTIVVNDEKNNILGDTEAEVAKKGFSIYLDPVSKNPDVKRRRPNTKEFSGAEALKAASINLSLPQTTTTEETAKLIEFQKKYKAHVFEEEDLLKVVDRFCFNERNSIEIGDIPGFVVLYKDGRADHTVINGGPVNITKSEKGMLICVFEDIGKMVGNSAEQGLKKAIDAIGF